MLHTQTMHFLTKLIFVHQIDENKIFQITPYEGYAKM